MARKRFMVTWYARDDHYSERLHETLVYAADIHDAAMKVKKTRKTFGYVEDVTEVENPRHLSMLQQTFPRYTYKEMLYGKGRNK